MSAGAQGSVWALAEGKDGTDDNTQRLARSACDFTVHPIAYRYV